MILWIKRIICLPFILLFSTALVVLPARLLLATLGLDMEQVNICAQILAVAVLILALWLCVRSWKKADAQQPSSGPKRSELSISKNLLTGIALMIAIPFSYFSFKDSREEVERQQQPGHAAFKNADLLLTGRSQGTIHGNTSDAQALAAEFSTYLKQARKLGVESRKSTAMISLTGGEFLTYCLITRDSCVFMVHVPELRQFSQDAKDFIADAAWATALAITEDRQSSLKNICVGIRGVLMYARVISGHPGSPSNAASLRHTEVDGDTESQEYLKAYFALPPPAANTAAMPPVSK